MHKQSHRRQERVRVNIQARSGLEMREQPRPLCLFEKMESLQAQPTLIVDTHQPPKA